MNGQRTLIDASNMPVATLRKDVFSIRRGWSMCHAQTNQLVCSLEAKIFTLTPNVKIYLNDGDKEPDFQVLGDFASRQFNIIQKLPGYDRQLATCTRMLPFQSMSAFLQTIAHKQSYYVHVEAGVDTSFIAAICTLIDELFLDEDPARPQANRVNNGGNKFAMDNGQLLGAFMKDLL